MPIEPFEVSFHGMKPTQIKGLDHIIYYMAVRLDALASLVRSHCSEEEYRQALERAEGDFPSTAIFPDPALREFLGDDDKTSRGGPADSGEGFPGGRPK